MKGLAEFVMRSRMRALLVVVASSGSLVLCWIGAAVTALVTLRRGPREGAWLLLWAILPALVLVRIAGDTSPLALLLGTFALALVLRLSVSLAMAVLASAVVGLVTGLLTLALGGEMLEQLSTVFAEFLQTLQQQAGSNANRVVLVAPTPLQLAGMMGTANAALGVLCLMLARYWQAGLYNPGGFATEFRALRFPVGVTVIVTAAALGLAGLGLQYRSWAAALLVPISVLGFALVHARASLRGQGSVWLTAVYVLWLVFDAVKLLLIGFAVLDSWLNFRARWGAGTTGSGGGAPRDDDAED